MNGKRDKANRFDWMNYYMFVMLGNRKCLEGKTFCALTAPRAGSPFLDLRFRS